MRDELTAQVGATALRVIGRCSPEMGLFRFVNHAMHDLMTETQN
jgi:hypothetical protein